MGSLDLVLAKNYKGTVVSVTRNYHVYKRNYKASFKDLSVSLKLTEKCKNKFVVFDKKKTICV